MRPDDRATSSGVGGMLRWLRRRRSAVCLAMAVLLLGAVAIARGPHIAAQDSSQEVHTGTFTIFREQTQTGVLTCQLSIFPVFAGVLQFTIDHRTNAVSGTLSGSGAAGWKDGAWDTFPDNSDPSRLHYWSFVAAKCDSQNPNGSRAARYISYVYHGTAQGTLLGSYDPTTNTITMEGDVSVTTMVRLIDCDDFENPTFGSTLPTRPCGFSNQGTPYDDEIKNGTQLPGSATAHVVLTGQRLSSSAGGGITTPTNPNNLIFFTTDGTWTTSFTPPPANTPTPTATPTATATAAPSPAPGPTGPPPTVCDSCPDQDWAQQQSASWAWTAAFAGVVYSGSTSMPATADQIAASQQQLQQCLVSGMATERQKPAAQQQSRQQVFNNCKSTLPVQLPVG